MTDYKDSIRMTHNSFNMSKVSYEIDIFALSGFVMYISSHLDRLYQI